MIAKELATLDVLSGGRLTVGVGVGGREHDYTAAGSTFDRRHARLDASVKEVKAIWAGAPPFVGSDPVGPTPVQGADIEILAGAMGPKGLGRAALWADGVSGFALTADGAEMAEAVEAATRAWSLAERSTSPRQVSGCFYVFGVDDPRATLQEFTYDYLAIFGRESPARSPTTPRSTLPSVSARPSTMPPQPVWTSSSSCPAPPTPPASLRPPRS